VKHLTIELKFNVADESLLREKWEDAIALGHTGGAEEGIDGGDLGEIAAEVLLHSNPAVAAYLDYGLELAGQRTNHWEEESK